MKVSFNGGFIVLPSSDTHINPNQITRIFTRNDGTTSIRTSDDEFFVTSAPISKVTAACLKAQAENTIVKLNSNN